MKSLNIGLVTSCALRASVLENLVVQCGHNSSVILTSQAQIQANIGALESAVDAWIVEIDGDDNGYSILDEWVSVVTEPVVFTNNCPSQRSPEYSAWSRRLSEKISHISGSINLASEQHIDAKACRINSVWLLAASTGGPEAVKSFLSQLPPDSGAAFIYVQHLDESFEQTLTEVIGRGSHYPVYAAEHGALLQNDAVAMISSGYCTELLENGTFINKREPWSGYFSPSVDQMAANVARSFGARANMIIFSGMESDGAIACRLIKQQGGQVWVQSPETCISPSMPEAALATDCVDFSGSSEELASKLAQYCAQDHKRQSNQI